MTIRELSNQPRKFYEVNFHKILTKLLTKKDSDLYKLSKDDIFDLSEIVSSLIFCKITENYFSSLNLTKIEEYKFLTTYSSFDVESDKNFYELKIRRKDFDYKKYIESEGEGGLLKKSKWEFARWKLNYKQFFYINICRDCIFIWDLNKMETILENKYSKKQFKNKVARNVSGNQKIDFLVLDIHYCHKILFYNGLTKDLDDVFTFVSNLEIVKQKRQIKL